MIFISADFFGPEHKESRIGHAISKAMQIMPKLRARNYDKTLGKIPHVNVIFFVEGSLGRRDFSGTRMGPFSRKDMCLEVDVEISLEDAAADDLRHVILDGLQGGNANAFHYFADKHSLDFPLRAAEALVKELGTYLEDFSSKEGASSSVH